MILGLGTKISKIIFKFKSELWTFFTEAIWGVCGVEVGVGILQPYYHVANHQLIFWSKMV